MRRREVEVDLELILTNVSRLCGVERQELLKLNSRQPGRRLAIILLVKEGGLSGREVERRLGLALSAPTGTNRANCDTNRLSGLLFYFENPIRNTVTE